MVGRVAGFTPFTVTAPPKGIMTIVYLLRFNPSVIGIVLLIMMLVFGAYVVITIVVEVLAVLFEMLSGNRK